MITPDEIDVQIIDATFFLHLHKDLSANFGGVAKYLLRSILERGGKVIHFVSDKWITLSIKDCETQSRNAADISYQITSAGQKRLINWLTALRSSSFKHHWWNSLFRLGQTVTILYYSKEKFFWLIVEVFAINLCQYWTKLQGLKKCHCHILLQKEADSRISFHISSLENQSNVVIKTVDAYCLIIGLKCRKGLDLFLKIWMEGGVQSRNNIQFVSVDSTYSNLGRNFRKTLSTYHMFI